MHHMAFKGEHSRWNGAILTCQTNGRFFRFKSARIIASVLQDANEAAEATRSRMLSARRTEDMVVQQERR